MLNLLRYPSQLKLTLGATALSLLLAGCGGSGSDSPAPGPGAGAGATSISGVAAAGLPLVGTVTVKDSLGATRMAAIGTSGSYTINVEGLTAPFVFRAEGRAGGREYQIYSAATAADVGGVINVTPLTDLVVANIAGELAADYFARNPDGALTADALNAEIAKLRERLLPVLTSLGVDSSIDLLRTPFTPLVTDLDKAIDILRVDYAGGVATITNVVTQQTIQDDLATQAAEEAAAEVLDETAGVADARTDIDQIRAALDNFSALFDGGLPAAGVAAAQLSSGFLFRDQTAAEFAAELASSDALVGADFTDVTIDGIDYSGANPIARVSFVIKGPAGNLIAPHEDNWQLIRQGGVWRLHGDQRVLDIESVAYMNKSSYRSGGGVAQTCVESGLSLRIEDYNPANNGGIVAYVTVTGPGIVGSARLNAPELNGFFRIDPQTSNGGVGNYFVAADSCNGLEGFELTGLASVPDNAIYTFRAYDAADNLLQTYTDRVPKRPLTLAELEASTEFPVITTPTFNAFAAYGGGNLTVSATGFDPLGLAAFNLFVGYTSGDSADAEAELLVPASGMLSAPLSVPASLGGGAINYRQLEIENLAPNGREFSTRYVIN